MRSIVLAVMNHPLLISRPPIFVDIGASGALPKEWVSLARYSICVAFDADNREFHVGQTENRNWKRLYTLNRLVSPRGSGEVDFYLTKSPFCSSSLPPNHKSLSEWAFAPLFEVEREMSLPAVDLQTVLANLAIDRVDWYKADTQGTDLRIFRALDGVMQRRVLVADFEPGIIDAYHGEDKLYDLLAYMEQGPFWISDMKVLGSQRINQAYLASFDRAQLHSISWWHKSAPGWCEVSYLNTLDDPSLGCREYLLAWTFATTKGEHGFALHVANLGEDKFGDPIFSKLRSFSRKRLKPTVSAYITRAGAKVLRAISTRR